MANLQEKNALIVPEIGLLSVIHVFVCYDYPITFATQDIFGSKYLVQKVFSENIEDFNWILVKITKERLQDLLNNRISLENALEKIEAVPQIWLLFHENKNQKDSLEKLGSFPKDLLPRGINETFVGKTPSLDPEHYDTLRHSILNEMGTLDIIFTSEKRGSFPAIIVEKTSASIRKFCFPSKENARELNVTMLPGSTVLRFEIDDIENLLDEESPHRKIRQLNEMFSNPTDIKNVCSNDKKTIIRFNEIVKNLSSGESQEVIISSAFPTNQNAFTKKFLKDDLENIEKEISKIEAEEKREYPIEAKLLGIESDQKTVRYEFNGEKVKAISKTPLNEIGFVFDKEYILNIEETNYKNVITDVVVKKIRSVLSITPKPEVQ